MAFETLLRTCSLDEVVHRVCYVDDLTFWGPSGAAATRWQPFLDACAEAGLELNLSKCH